MSSMFNSKAKAGMVHSVSGWTRGVQIKLWERVPYLSALEVCSRRGAIQIHVYLYLYLYYDIFSLSYIDFCADRYTRTDTQTYRRTPRETHRGLDRHT